MRVTVLPLGDETMSDPSDEPTSACEWGGTGPIGCIADVVVSLADAETV